jgi:SagB-type dehydrogenase family enzyme
LDREKPLSKEAFSQILYYVFGCHGVLPLLDRDVVAVKKTSPSGGGLHPTEVYPLVMNVDGVPPGAYHYSIGKHSLELITRLDEETARKWADEFTAGQVYPGWAQVIFVMTSRFYRHQWKYRRHEKAYGVLMMDAGHLSQTFYLVCADLGIGSFVTAAINSDNIESRLGLDRFAEGAILISGCGAPIEAGELGSGLDPQFQAFEPREARGL